MPNVDQFESVFNSAAKEVYRYQAFRYERVLVVTDLDESEAEVFGGRVRGFLGGGQTVEAVGGGAYDDVQGLLDLVERKNPDLVCAYRNLKAPGRRWGYSLGVYVDVLTQVAQCPVLLLPTPPTTDGGDGELPTGIDTVMAMTDHLAGDNRLINAALGMLGDGGRLWLLHIEDQSVFERYIGVISKIPGIDTQTAREAISKQLLKEPRDYIASCAAVIKEKGLAVQIEQVVAMGHHLDEYKRLVFEHDLDLLVLNTKDEDQMAMHGLAYPLAVELGSVPMLLL